MFENQFCLVNAPAGIWYGTVVSADTESVVLENARNIFSWEGAFTISDLATVGTIKPEGCRVPRSVPKVWLIKPEAVIPCTEQSKQCLQSLAVWTADHSKHGIIQEQKGT